MDYSFLEAFCRDVVMQQYTPAQKHAVMAAFVDAFAGGAMPNDQLEKILQVGKCRLSIDGTKQGRARGGEAVGHGQGQGCTLYDPWGGDRTATSSFLFRLLLHCKPQLFSMFLQVLITPMLVDALERGQREVLAGGGLIERIMNELLDPTESKSAGQCGSVWL